MFITEISITDDNKNLEIFMNAFNLEYLINNPVCFQSENLWCTDLILINKKELLKHLEVIQLGISDHHGFAVTSLKIQFVKGRGKKLT